MKSLRLLVDDRPVGAFPILTLGGEEKLHVSFDKMSHEFVRYTYRIEHLDRDFKPENGLFSADYVDGASTEKVIEDYTTTTNTTVPYTHYEFTLPSSRMRPLLSGNYRLTIETEGEDGEPVPVAETYFYIVEPLVSITSTASTDTEIDRDETHQQLTLAVDFSRLSPRNATEELSLVVLKNNRWSDAVRHPRPTAETGTRLLWEHSRELIFNAGNEFRKFEIPSTRYPGMHVDGVSYHAPLYHATVAQDDLRRNYLYDEDQNGRYVFLAEGEKILILRGTT